MRISIHTMPIRRQGTTTCEFLRRQVHRTPSPKADVLRRHAKLPGPLLVGFVSLGRIKRHWQRWKPWPHTQLTEVRPWRRRSPAYLPFLDFICPRLTAIPPSAFFSRTAISFATVSANCLVMILTLSFVMVHLSPGKPSWKRNLLFNAILCVLSPLVSWFT